MTERRRLRGLKPATRTRFALVVDDLPAEWRDAVYSGVVPIGDGPQVDVGGIPVQLGAEIAWLVRWQLGDGGSVNRRAIDRVLDALRWAASSGKHIPDSMADWDWAQWDGLLREYVYALTGRLPANGTSGLPIKTFLGLPVVALRSRFAKEWWQADYWRLRCDPRIPRRPIEPAEEDGVDWTRIRSAWVAQAGKQFAASLLSSGDITWSTLTHRVVVALTYFDRWLSDIADLPSLFDGSRSLVDAPRLFNTWVADHARQPPSTREANYHLRWVARLIDYAAATPDLVDAPWGRATETQASAWLKAVSRVRHRVDFNEEYFIDDTTVSQIVAHIPILGAASSESFQLPTASDEPLTISGMGDPQAMRILLLQILTGRRASEVVLAPWDCLSKPASVSADPGLARFRYAQSKIDHAPNTILVDTEVVEIIEEQRRWLTEQLPGCQPTHLFVRRSGNKHGLKAYSMDTYWDVLGRFSRLLGVNDRQGKPVRLTHTHRFRHTKLTKLAELGLPIQVLQRYAGHLTPTMTMHYIANREEFQEQVFVATRRYRADGEQITLSREVYDGMQLFERADRILPNGYCLLPVPQTCDKGNACLTCGVFVTDASHLETLKRMLADTDALINREQGRFQARHGVPMPADNVWLRERLIEREALNRLISKIEAVPAGAIEGGGAQARGNLAPVTLRPTRQGRPR